MRKLILLICIIALSSCRKEDEVKPSQSELQAEIDAMNNAFGDNFEDTTSIPKPRITEHLNNTKR